jgi:hypothetical protein
LKPAFGTARSLSALLRASRRRKPQSVCPDWLGQPILSRGPLLRAHVQTSGLTCGRREPYTGARNDSILARVERVQSSTAARQKGLRPNRAMIISSAVLLGGIVRNLACNAIQICRQAAVFVSYGGAAAACFPQRDRHALAATISVDRAVPVRADTRVALAFQGRPLPRNSQGSYS